MKKILITISALFWYVFSNAASNVSFLNYRKKLDLADSDEKLILNRPSLLGGYWVEGSDSKGSHNNHWSHRSHISHYSSYIVSSTHISSTRDSIQPVSESQKAWIIKNIAKDNKIKKSGVKLKHAYFAKNCTITKSRDSYLLGKETIPNSIRVLYCEVDLGNSFLEYIIPIQETYKVHMYNGAQECFQEKSPWMKVILSK